MNDKIIGISISGVSKTKYYLIKFNNNELFIDSNKLNDTNISNINNIQEINKWLNSTSGSEWLHKNKEE